MPHFKLAHVTEQGIDLIIIPLDRNFGFKSPQEQNSAVQELQARARAARLAGVVVPVWPDSSGRIAFLAPINWHPFFQSINFDWVATNINRELSW